MIKVGVGVSYYGPAAPAHRDSIRGIKGKGIEIIELSGSAYPEMAYAELCRAALADELDVLVLVSHRSAFSLGSLKHLAETAHARQAILSATSTSATPAPLAFTAIPIAVLAAMAERDERTYTNTGILDTGFSEKSRPFASPWAQRTDGSLNVDSLEGDLYLTPEEALLLRAKRAGFEEGKLTSATYNYLGHAAPTLRMVLGDASKRKAEGIPHNYAFCVPTFGGLDHHQQDALWNLELAGCTTIEYRDCPYIDQARSYLTKLALDTGHDGIFFIDHDIMFRPIDALEMISEAEAKQDVVSAVYCMRKTAHSLIGATAVEVGTEVTFFDGGGLVPALYSGLGFSAIPKEVINALDGQLPQLYSTYLKAHVRPYYALDVNCSFYSGEDASFCARVQGLTIKMIAGSANPNGHDWDLTPEASKALTRHKVWLDTRPRIYHRGSYDYGIEDHSIAVPRYGSIKATLVASRAELRRFLASEMSLKAREHSQGVNEGATTPHSILEERGPCMNCSHPESNHAKGVGDRCENYVEMTKLQSLVAQ